MPSATSIEPTSCRHDAARAQRTIPLRLSLAALIAASAALADDGQLLVTHSSSLTTMQLTAPTNVQDVLPHVLQRGVNLDGSARAGSAFGWRLNANAIGGGTVGGRTLGEIDLATGSPVVTAVDLSLPAKQPWVIGRSYSGRQDDAGHHDSNGYQGRNWFQMSQPELVFFDSTDAEDMLYLVYGADRFIEFRRVALQAGGYSATEFRAVNGAAGVFSLSRDSGTGPDTWTYHDQAGATAVFFGFDDDAGGNSPDANGAAGQLWKVSDPAGNTAYVGDSSTISTAISSGYDGSGRILKAYDSVGRRYCYTYSTIDSVSRLTQVICETDAGGGWGDCGTETMVGKVEYGYYQTGDNTYGDNGCLELVTVTTPLTDSGVNLVAKTYFRYWKGAFNDSTNPGHPYALQYIVGAEGYRQADWADADLTDNDPQSTSSRSRPAPANGRPTRTILSGWPATTAPSSGWTRRRVCASALSWDRGSSCSPLRNSRGGPAARLAQKKAAAREPGRRVHAGQTLRIAQKAIRGGSRREPRSHRAGLGAPPSASEAGRRRSSWGTARVGIANSGTRSDRCSGDTVRSACRWGSRTGSGRWCRRRGGVGPGTRAACRGSKRTR